MRVRVHVRVRVRAAGGGGGGGGGGGRTSDATMRAVEAVFTLVYLIEMALKLHVLGCAAYWLHSPRHCFDGTNE
eukprot:COSAG05_NODE_1995_length_3729_cov_4.415427_6_plen_74_part_00